MISMGMIEKLKEIYPVGARVELIQMDDEQSPPVGALGTVYGVDSLSSVLVNWDNGSTLNVLYKIDRIKKVE